MCASRSRATRRRRRRCIVASASLCRSGARNKRCGRRASCRRPICRARSNSTRPFTLRFMKRRIRRSWWKSSARSGSRRGLRSISICAPIRNGWRRATRSRFMPMCVKPSPPAMLLRRSTALPPTSAVPRILFFLAAVSPAETFPNYPGAIMDLDIRGLRVLVTAGAGGIGLAIARRFAAEGARVHTCDVGEVALSAIAASDPAVSTTPCDVSDRSAVQRLFAEALAKLGGLDVLVNNAGVAGPTAKIDEMNPEDWDRCLEICLTGQFNCTRLAVPHLRKSKNASIVNISSAAGRLGFAMRTPYAAAKWGVIGLTKSLSIELGADNIRVNAILPGLVAGDRQRRVLEAKAQQRGISYAEMERTAFSYTSIKDYVTPEQIADQILFMCSPRGRTISGQAISICGDTQMLG